MTCNFTVFKEISQYFFTIGYTYKKHTFYPEAYNDLFLFNYIAILIVLCVWLLISAEMYQDDHYAQTN